MEKGLFFSFTNMFSKKRIHFNNSLIDKKIFFIYTHENDEEFKDIFVMKEIIEKKVEVADKELIFRLNEYAFQANGSIVLQCGETLVQAVVVMGNENPDLDFFPLTVEYNENLYAGGMIKSSKYIKREGKPSDEAILKARLIDRTIRPMFPKDFYREVQVIINVLSSDKKNPHDVLGLTASIAALAISDIPFDSNLAGIRVSRVAGKWEINPTYDKCAAQDFELVLGGNSERIVMIECAAERAEDKIVEEGFGKSFEYLGKIAAGIKELEKNYGKTKVIYTGKEVYVKEVYDIIKSETLKKIDDFYKGLANKSIERREFDKIIIEPIVALFQKEEDDTLFTAKNIKDAIDKIFKENLRKEILTNSRRIDGRGIEEVREINIRINPIPRVHGSVMFARGETQVLNILTLASPGSEQVYETIEGESSKRYIHHYNAPPYSVGETGRYGGSGRREIGHGALAEKALKPVIPNQMDFPYVMRLVSEVMGQNGSSSMASTCASTLSLMAGGVPIKEAVAGISIGLITAESGNDFITLTDIMGFEDFAGDMDFKVAGTRESITAIQMDTKIKGLTFEIIKKSISQAKVARNKILDIMLSVLPQSNKDLSIHAPTIETTSVPVDSIGKIVGPGGKMIRQLQQDYSVTISITDDGTVSITGQDKATLDNVKKVIRGIAYDPVVGEIYTGKVVRIMDFGAFVEIFPGKEGLVHVSQMSKEHVESVSSILKVGQMVDVKLFEIDFQGRLNFTMLLDEDVKKRSVSTKSFNDRKDRDGKFDRKRR